MSYTYLILFDFISNSKFASYLIPNNEITFENRESLQRMQQYGQLDSNKDENFSKQDKMEENTIVLYLFEKSMKVTFKEDDAEFVAARNEGYKKLNEKDFTELSKWVKYKRQSNQDVQHSITHVYEITNNTYK